MPQIVPVILSAAATWGPFGAAIGSFTLMQSFLIRAALGLALGALAPKPSGGTRGYSVTYSGSAGHHQIIYGKARVSGARIADFSTGDQNKYLHRVIAMAGHEVNSMDDYYIGNQKVTDLELLSTDGDGIPSYNVKEVADVDEDGVVVEDTRSDKWDGFITIRPHLGSPDQVADSTLVTDVSEWTSNHRLRGIAYVVMVCKYDTSKYSGGPPELRVDIKGKSVYDPRDSSTSWSDNYALCIRDYLTQEHGLEEDSDRIDDVLFQVAANVCDETASNGEARYTCNGAFLTNVQPYDVLMSFSTGMAGLIWYSQGKWRVKAGKWTSTVLDLNEDDLRSSIAVETRRSRRDSFNGVKGTFQGDETNWTLSDYPEVRSHTAMTVANGYASNTEETAGTFTYGNWYEIKTVGTTDFTLYGAASNTVGHQFQASGAGAGTGVAYATEDTYLSADNNQTSVLDLDLSHTDNSEECRRVARITLEANRQQLVCRATFGMSAFQCQVGDNVRLTYSRFGWDNKEFLVSDWNFGFVSIEGSGFDLQIELTLQETASSVYDEIDDGAVYERDNTTLYDRFTVPNAELNDPETQFVPYSSGTLFPKLVFSWTAEGDEVERTLVQWRETYVDFDASGGIVDFSTLTTTREEDVYAIYREELRRSPDVDGFDFHVNSASSIAQIRDTIVNSAEYAAQGDFSSTYVKTFNHEITPVKVGTTYDIVVQSQNALGVYGYASVISYEVEDDDTAPPVPVWDSADTTSGSTITNVVQGIVATIRWEDLRTSGGNPVFDLAETEVWRTNNVTISLDTNGDPTNATFLGSGAKKTGVLNEFIDATGSPSTTYKYYLRSVDYSGNKSAFDVGRSVTTDSPAANTVGVIVSPESIVVPTDSAGDNGDYSSANVVMTILVGATDDSANWTMTYDDRSSVGITYTVTNGTKTVAITDSDVDSGWLDVVLSKSGYSSITKRVLITKNLAGASGSAGDDGLRVELSPPVVTVFGDVSGVVASYLNTGCTIKVWEGDTELAYDTTPDGSDWEIVSTSVSPSGDLTVGSITGGVVANHSGMDSGTDVVTVTYNIEGKRADGTDFTTSVDQSVRKITTADKIAQGIVYYQTAETSNPGTPSATSYNFSTGAFTGLTASWDHQLPPIDASTVTKSRWSSTYVVSENGITGTQTITFATPTGENLFVNQLTMDLIASEAIVTDKLANLAITTAKIASGAITETQIEDDAITTGKIAANAVTAAEIAALTISASEIAANAIVAGKIDTNAVTSGTIAAGAITALKIDAGAVTTAKLDAGAVTTDKITALAITGEKIAVDTVQASKLILDNITLDTDGDNLIIKTSGVDTGQLAYQAAIMVDTERSLSSETSDSISIQDIVQGERYLIDTLGTSDFTNVGASSNTVDKEFYATRDGTSSDGTGTVSPGFATCVELELDIDFDATNTLLWSFEQSYAGTGATWSYRILRIPGIDPTLGIYEPDPENPGSRDQDIYDAYLEVIYQPPDPTGFTYYSSGGGSSDSIESIKNSLIVTGTHVGKIVRDRFRMSAVSDQPSGHEYSFYNSNPGFPTKYVLQWSGHDSGANTVSAIGTLTNLVYKKA